MLPAPSTVVPGATVKPSVPSPEILVNITVIWVGEFVINRIEPAAVPV